MSRWLKEQGGSITAQSIGKHAKDHVGVSSTLGRRPASGDFLTDVVSAAQAGLESGELAVTLKDGIAAQGKLDARQARDADRDVLFRLSLVLSGSAPVAPRLANPENEAIEAEFRQLLEPGDMDDRPEGTSE